MLELLHSRQLISLHHEAQAGNNILIDGLWNAPKALVAAIVQKATGKHVVIITGTGQEEAKLFHDFPIFTERSVVDFPAWEALPNENIPPSPDIVGERYQVLQDIYTANEPFIILTSLQACLQKLIPAETFEQLHISLKTGDVHSFEGLIKKLNDLGYYRSPTASDKGEYAIRGGIIDIFPVSLPDPYRIEFWGDKIESIRIYDPIGQKSIRSVETISLTPAQELEMIQKETRLHTLFDYLGKDTVIIFDDLLSIEDRYAQLMSVLEGKTPSFASLDELFIQLEPMQKIFWTAHSIEQMTQVKVIEKREGSVYSAQAPMYSVQFEMFDRTFGAKRWHHSFKRLPEYLFSEDEELSGEEILQQLAEKGEGDLYILCNNELEEKSLHKKALESNIALPEKTQFLYGYLSSGFALADVPCAILPYTEITRRYKIRRQKLRSTYHTTNTLPYEIQPGDIIVHFHHGIGRFLGVERRADHNQITRDFFLIEFANQSKLYVPLNQAHLLTKYIGASEEMPHLHSIGSARWQRTREKTQQAIMGYATELLEIYAKRELHGGFACGPDSPDMAAFEEDFPFVETEDQLAAIAALKQDMCSKRAMDRLVCGDVGYGKTEVAMRAAFKAVVDGGKQVAILVPTTMLAMQHYETFIDRMANFPIRIGVMSRFLKPKQIKETLQGAATGTVDIVIGTHRIISEDVAFKDLGLIIIDEEQRFGVKAKEHLKKIKIGVDCLTLSATPIPRTLYMSLVGARDMSVINTPPQDRLPIKTTICEPNEKTILNALIRELSRDGQAYVIHNRVETIFEYASYIQKLLPQARILVGHGQMSSAEIDSVFHTFKNGNADILIATTIVENGIDIPNANTILIDHAERFGLADLYQLRGRVGRWNRRAYAYFLISKLHLLPEISRKRLDALAETSGHGGGMRVAMRDLEIRGAGHLLGFEQSGHVVDIGFSLYCKMLDKTVQTLKGKIAPSLMDSRVECSIDARFPESYLPEASLRMEFYQRLCDAASWEEIDEIWGELQDRFGAPPEQATWLYHLSRIKTFAGKHAINTVRIDKFSVSAEKQQGKNITSKKVLLKPAKDPETWEKSIIEALHSLTEQLGSVQQ